MPTPAARKSAFEQPRCVSSADTVCPRPQLSGRSCCLLPHRCARPHLPFYLRGAIRARPQIVLIRHINGRLRAPLPKHRKALSSHPASRSLRSHPHGTGYQPQPSPPHARTAHSSPTISSTARAAIARNGQGESDRVLLRLATPRLTRVWALTQHAFGRLHWRTSSHASGYNFPTSPES